MRSHGFQILFFVFILFIGSSGYSQTNLKKIKEWKASKVNLLTVDRLGNFFLVNSKGKIKKYDATGKLVASVSKTTPALLEPWYHPSIFVYSRKNQTYSVYGRNFEDRKDYLIEPALAIESTLVCPTHDNKLWILDKADWSLKKVNPLTSEVIQEFALDTSLFKASTDFIYLREYLNLIFLVDKNSGILILNHLGKAIETIAIQNPKQVYFFGDELYYLENNTLKFFNLLTEERHEVKLPDETAQAVMTDELIITLNFRNRVSLYTYALTAQ
ncbi:MAG: hypothetical protein ABL895_17230 [Cyclobacteriaceae bacterium]